MKRLVVVSTVVFVSALLIGLLASQIIAARTPPAVAPLTAQAGSNSQVSIVSFEGPLSQGSLMVPSTWIVDAYLFQVDAETEIVTNGLAVQPGVWVRVEAVKDEQQLLRARKVALQRPPSGDLFDRIVSLDPVTGFWLVGDTDVIIGDQTLVQGTPALGALVQVRGQWSLDGLAADQVIVQAPVENVVYQGEIRQQQAGQWMVDDVTVDLSDSPPILGVPEIGALVEVYGIETSPRHLRAQAIMVSAGLAEFQHRDGWLVSVENGNYPHLWRVNLLEGADLAPVYLAVFENTEIDETAATAGYRSWLDIQADNTGAGYYRARHIVVLPRPPKQTITGIVEQMPEASPIGQWRVSGHRVEVLPDTAVIGGPQVGSLVTVLGTPDYSNALTAESIQRLGE